MKKPFAIISVVLCAALSLQAQTLSLDSCISLALAHNRTIQASLVQAEKLSHDVKAYRANFFPNVKLSAQDLWSSSDGNFGVDGGYLPTYNFDPVSGSLKPNVMINPGTGTPVMNGDVPVFNQYAYFPGLNIDYKVGNIFNAGVLIEQPLYMGGKILAAYRMSKLGREMADLGVRLSRDQVVVAVSEAYSLVVKSDAMYRVAVEYDSLLQTLMTDVRNAERRGLRTHNDVLKVQVKLAESELQMRQAENARQLSRMNLCHHIGLPLSSQIDAMEQMPDLFPAVSDASAEAVSSRPEYEILELKSQLAERQVQVDRSDFLPQVVLGASYGYTDGLEVLNTKMFRKPSLGVMLSVSVPIFHGGEGVHKVRSARLEAERTRLEQEELVGKMMLEVAQAANTLDEAGYELVLAQKSLAQAEENLRSVRKGFAVGTESLSDVFEAQTLWQQASAKLATSRTSLFVASVKYQKAAGRL
ncbi:MAG: TolC family protein [Bacteroidales bacterium]|nr:TolC family protein [Candidatus Liminaster caballi]